MPEAPLFPLRPRLVTHFSASLLLSIFVFGASQFDLDSLQGLLVDLLFRTRPWSEPQPDIVTIAYDEASSARYGGSLKLPSEEIRELFDVLKEEGPKAVGVIAAINEKLYSSDELGLIAKAVSSLPNTVIGFLDEEMLGKPPPAPLFGVVKFLPGIVSKDNFSYGADSVTRRVMIAIEGYPTAFAELARLYRNMPRSQLFRNVFSFGKAGNTFQTFLHWQGAPEVYPPYSSHSIIERSFRRGTFKDKVVLIGNTIPSVRGNEYLFTPYSREPNQTTLLEGAAQSLGTLMQNSGIAKVPGAAVLALSLIVGVVTVNLALFLSPGRGIAFTVGEVAALVGLGWTALNFCGRWLDLAHPIIAACVGYYLVIPYRLIDEYRKRWHYQEKTEFMVQLEQLKSNFLSLISHDLKTPIARVQGNAELIMNGANLTDDQRRSLRAIVATTEDLSEYVETVLDLTRIEGAQLTIQKTSKDINAIIQEVVESKRYLASEKNITLETQLEPLFSIKFDVKLIRRVIANLVENAIKYSPAHTKILLKSHEEGEWIRVSVADEGFGISAVDQPKVFGKFYRCETDATKSTKGTGLGLYLVKYFVELHRGAVELKSELGKGSVFTISLPV